jgi:hypothetical protein
MALARRRWLWRRADRLLREAAARALAARPDSEEAEDE